MFSFARRLISKAPIVNSAKNYHSNGYLGNVVAIPCRDKTSTMEITAMAGVMICCWLAVPVWVLVHVRDYNGQRKAERGE